jgi:F-type H+-transporting ATPase subunit delta
MSNVPVARRYARALLDAAGANADAVLEQISGLASFFTEQTEFFEAAANPTQTRTQRMAIVDAVIASASDLAPVLANLLKLLIDRNRFAALPDIARAYRELVDARMGRVRGRVMSAVKLGDEQIAALKKQLEALTQRSVVLETSVDPQLLGGVVATVGSHQYDGSLRSQLNELGRSLTHS